jgi:oligoribonuclease NrnB/cAMP/cGMP phosphodiesterase (DHH superfamily)
MKDIVVIYHDQCKDGFGAAYAAWKKFGDTATYIPLVAGAAVPEGLFNKEIYIVDFSFDLATLANLRKTNTKVIVIDHHQSARAAVTTFPDNVFALDHSGAVLAWHYFHPQTPPPRLLTYIEDHDLWQFLLPHNQEINAALALEKATFERWDELAAALDDNTEFEKFVAVGATATLVNDKLVDELLTYAERVLFEGHEVWAVNVARPHRSIIGHRLAQKNARAGGIPLGIVYYRNRGAIHVSLRSEGDVDVATIAEKYGGGGHRHAASIRVPDFQDLPFSFLTLPGPRGALE